MPQPGATPEQRQEAARVVTGLMESGALAGVEVPGEPGELLLPVGIRLMNRPAVQAALREARLEHVAAAARQLLVGLEEVERQGRAVNRQPEE